MNADQEGMINNIVKDKTYYLQQANKELVEKLKEIKVIKNDLTYEIFYYFIVISIMCFFIFIILSNIAKIINLYKRNNFTIKISRLVDFDNNVYDNNYLFDTVNYSENITESVNAASKQQVSELENITELKKRNNVDSAIYGQINQMALSKEHDDYVYNNTKKGIQTYWDLLFEEPKYKHIVNSLQ